MKHFHLDEFAKMNSFVHGLDPRAKIVATLVFIFLVAGINSPALLFSAAVFWLFLLLWSGIPPGYIVSRILWIIPFAGALVIVFPFIKPGVTIWQWDLGLFELIATYEGLNQAVVLLARVLASIMAVLFLTLTTRFHYVLKALAVLKVPLILLQLLEFTVRYIFVTLDELKRMRRARKARSFQAGRNLWHLHTLRTLGQLVGSLFLRSYERGERVYLAMLSRGYTGKMQTLRDFYLTGKDLVWAVFTIGLAVILVILDRKEWLI